MVRMEENDLELVDRVRAGDTDAFREVVESHSRTLFQTAFRLVGNSEDADDVVQETFLKAYPVAFPVLADRDLSGAKRWGVRVLPTTFVLDPAGKIRYSAVGERDWNTPEIEALCRSLLP